MFLLSDNVSSLKKAVCLFLASPFKCHRYGNSIFGLMQYKKIIAANTKKKCSRGQPLDFRKVDINMLFKVSLTGYNVIESSYFFHESAATELQGEQILSGSCFTNKTNASSGYSTCHLALTVEKI